MKAISNYFKLVIILHTFTLIFNVTIPLQSVTVHLIFLLTHSLFKSLEQSKRFNQSINYLKSRLIFRFFAL